jgi:penicillin-insensitive murein DD-endopeptidase
MPGAIGGSALSIRKMTLRRALLAACLAPLSIAIAFAVYVAWLGRDGGRASICYGTVVNGHLEGGRRLPYAGDNYRAYSLLGFLLGRTFVHETVRETMRDAYQDLSKSHPELRFVYAESGWPWGGRFAPHRSHANGTAADFHVPVRTLDGQVSELPTWAFNQFGYAVEFDNTGRAGAHRIDFEAMGQHLLALDRAAHAHGISIRRVIFDVGLQPKLAASPAGGQAMKRLAFNRQQAWVRHDEHYHIDFAVPCR